MFSKQFKIISFEIAALLLVPFLFVGLCLILLFTIPLLIYRHVIQGAAKILKPSLEMMDPSSQAVTNFDLGIGLNNTMTQVTILKGQLSVESLRRIFQNKFIDNSAGSRDVRNYRLLQKFPVTFCGYHFWDQDPDFRLENHIRYYCDGGKRVSEEKLKEILGDLNETPWREGMSPWEMLIIPNYEDGSKSVLVSRTCHSLGDGISVLRIFEELSGQSSEWVSERSPKNIRGMFRRIFSGLILPLLVLHDLAKFILRLDLRRSWWLVENSAVGVPPCFISWTKPIPLQVVKDIKNEFRVSFHSVLAAAVAGAISKVSVLSWNSKESCKRMAYAKPLLLPHHPKGLANHFGSSVVELPLRIEDPVQRLQKCFDLLRKVESPRTALLSFWIQKLVGHFPSSFHRLTPQRVSLGISNFSGLKSESFIDDVKVDSGFGTVTVLSRNAGGLVFAFSSVDSIIITVTVQKKLRVQREFVDKFVEFIEEEIYHLQGLVEVC